MVQERLEWFYRPVDEFVRQFGAKGGFVTTDSTDCARLAKVKARSWFYNFDLPDGSQTNSFVAPDVARVHVTRRDHLRRVIATRVSEPHLLTALDLACHEGCFSIELARHFSTVRGLELRSDTIALARLITEVAGTPNIEYLEANLEEIAFDPNLCADFVLAYGLIYHLENPIRVLRLASRLCRQYILVETQVFPYDISGQIEDGAFDNQRAVAGVFALAPDYPQSREGGVGTLALIPSLNALVQRDRVHRYRGASSEAIGL
jgi:hypothetical protein